MADVVVIGSLNMDLVVQTHHIPRPGETIHGNDFQTIPGGKGANQAAAAARLGADVAMVGRVGNDDFGPVLLRNMEKQGVDVSHVTLDETASSGIALITIDANGENTIVVAPGANGNVSSQDLAKGDELLAKARYLIMQFEVPLPTVAKAVKMAQARGVRVILNPAPAYPVDDTFLDGVYCLVVNETEAELMTKISVQDLDQATQAAQKLLDKRIPVVVVTLGEQGALLTTKELVAHIPAQKVQVVDTTAAGDAFVGGLTNALLQDMPLVEAVRYATCAGTLATTVLGAQTSIPSADQVRTFYEESGY